ncbi:MAG: hypothetical protein ACE1ZA_04645 [Pseudomonadales bacterium]
MTRLAELFREWRELETRGAYYATGFVYGAGWMLFIVVLLTS